MPDDHSTTDSTLVGFSAKLRFWLEVGDRKIRLSHMSSDYMIVNERIELAPCDATLRFFVDGEDWSRNLWLLFGIHPKIEKTLYLDYDNPEWFVARPQRIRETRARIRRYLEQRGEDASWVDSHFD